MKKECLACGEIDELQLKIIEFGVPADKWWMCTKCLENKNDEWTIAKEKFYKK